MPIGLTKTTADICLGSDAAASEAERPTFEFRFLSERRFRELLELRRKAAQAEQEKDADHHATRRQALTLALAGWRNMRATDPDLAAMFGVDTAATPAPWHLPFKPDLIAELLTIDEQWELIDELPLKLRLSEAEVKKSLTSATPAASTEGSAATAGAASVASNPPQSNPSTSGDSAPPATATTPSA
jgi:hypothetical protein